KKNGYKIEYIVADGKENENIGGIKIIDVGYSKIRLFRPFTSTLRIYRYFKISDSNIIHFLDPGFLIYALFLKKKIVIYDVHEDVPQDIFTKHYIPFFLKHVISFITRKIEDFVSKRLSGIITATPHLAYKFKKINPNTIDINNYPSLSEFNHQPTTEKQKAVCYIGELTKVRGIKEIVQAINGTDTKLILGGRFPDENFFQSIIKINSWKQVDFLGYLSRKDVQRVYNISIAGLVILHPTKSFYYSLPVKMFEYMAMGLPVIATNIPLWKEIIDKYNCGICVTYDNIEEIAEAIKKLVSLPKLAAKLGENGKIAVHNHFNWEEEEKKLLNFYKDL
ncbi:MAG: glycosyltransferase family 4 protein, partial [Clostridiales bacterium]